MMFTPREEKIKIKKSQKRVKTAFFLLVVLLIISTFGFLVRIYRQVEFPPFGEEKILKPISGGGSAENELAQEFKKADLRIISVSITGEKEIEASISGGTKVIFKTEEIGQQVSSLQLMLTRFKIEGRIPKKIDLRFEKPIVVF